MARKSRSRNRKSKRNPAPPRKAGGKRSAASATEGKVSERSLAQGELEFEKPTSRPDVPKPSTEDPVEQTAPANPSPELSGANEAAEPPPEPAAQESSPHKASTDAAAKKAPAKKAPAKKAPAKKAPAKKAPAKKAPVKKALLQKSTGPQPSASENLAARLERPAPAPDETPLAEASPPPSRASDENQSPPSPAEAETTVIEAKSPPSTGEADLTNPRPEPPEPVPATSEAPAEDINAVFRGARKSVAEFIRLEAEAPDSPPHSQQPLPTPQRRIPLPTPPECEEPPAAVQALAPSEAEAPSEKASEDDSEDPFRSLRHQSASPALLAKGSPISVEDLRKGMRESNRARPLLEMDEGTSKPSFFKRLFSRFKKS